MTAIGLWWNQSTNTYTRKESAVGLTGGAAFNSIMPYAGLRRVNLIDSGRVSAFWGDHCYSDTDVTTMGQCMVMIPKFYYYTAHSPPTYKWYISDTGTDTVNGSAVSWKVHPAFVRNGVTKDIIYIGAYEATYHAGFTSIESKAGQIVSGGQDLAQWRSRIEARGGGVPNTWEPQDYLISSAVQLLILLEYGTFVIQPLISAGITNLAELHRITACRTGHTATLGNTSGGVKFMTSAADGMDSRDSPTLTQACNYRGIENFWGNSETVVDGINVKVGEQPWIADHNFVSCAIGDTTTGFEGTVYENTGLTLASVNGWASDLAQNATYDYGFLPSATSASAGPYIAYDEQMATNYICVCGGLYLYGAYCTPFTWWGNGPTAESNNFGCRVMYIG